MHGRDEQVGHLLNFVRVLLERMSPTEKPRGYDRRHDRDVTREQIIHESAKAKALAREAMR